MLTVVHPVTDLARAKQVFTALLGVEPYVDQPYYVGYRTDGAELGLDPNGAARGLVGPVSFWPVADAAATVAALLAAGATQEQPITDVGGGMLTAVVRDPDGNLVGLRQSP